MTDRPDPFDVDRLLEQAFAGRRHLGGARPSLGDVRRRARRRQRRTVGGITAAAAVVGVGGVAAIAGREPGAPGAAGSTDGSTECMPTGPTGPTTSILSSWQTTTLAPGVERDGVSPTTSFDGLGVDTTTFGMPERFYRVQPGDGDLRWIARKFDVPVEDLVTLNGLSGPDAAVETGQVLRITSAALEGVYLEPGASTSLYPPIATSTTAVEGDILVTDTGPAVEATTPCTPVGAPTLPVEPTTTFVGRVQVLVVDGSGVEGAVAAVSEIVAAIGDVDFTVTPATRPVEQTMVMPVSDGIGLSSALAGKLSVGGFDTWTPDLVSIDTPLDGVVTVVVIGADWPDRWAASNTTSTTVP